MESAESTLVHHLLDSRASVSPDAVALRQAGRRWTYAQLRQLSLVYARWLAECGVARGDRVLIAAPHAAVTVPLIYAASRLGALYVVIDDQTRPYLLRHIAADCEPSIVVTAGDPSADLLAAFGASVRPVPAESELIGVDGGEPEDQPCLSVDPVSLLYTSGSTAMPKAVVSAHREVIFAARAIASQLRYRPDDVVFCCLPLSFDYGLYQVYLCCLAGATLVVGEPGDAGPPLLEALRRGEVTVLPALPTIATVLAMLVGRSGTPPRRLRMMTNTGAALPSSLVDRLARLLPDTAMVSMFGLTECKRATITPLDQIGRRPGSAGVALPGTEIYVVDEDGNRLPAGDVGELVVRGPNVMSGYWRAPELTARRFRQDEFGARLLHTGDLCRVDPDGHLYFLGRRDDLYKQHGVRMSAVEVEAAATDIAGVTGAALLPPTVDRGAVLFVMGETSVMGVQDGLAHRLGRPRLPAEIRVVESLPLRPNGKVDKRGLESRLSQSAEDQVPA